MITIYLKKYLYSIYLGETWRVPLTAVKELLTAASVYGAFINPPFDQSRCSIDILSYFDGLEHHCGISMANALEIQHGSVLLLRFNAVANIFANADAAFIL